MIDKRLFLKIDLLLVALMCILLTVPYLKYLSRGMVSFLPLYSLWLLFRLRNGISVAFANRIKENVLLFFLLCSFILVNIALYIFLQPSTKAMSWILTLGYFLFFLIIKMVYEEKELAVILFYIIVALGINSLISIPYILNSSEFVSRLMASGQLDETENIEALKNGVGTNALYTSNVLFAFLGLRFRAFFKGKKKLLFTASIVLIVISIVLSTFLASLFLLFLGLFAYFILSSSASGKQKSIKVFLIFLLGGIFLSWEYIKSLDYKILQPIFFKVDGFLGNTGQVKDVTGRSELTRSSIKSFLENPFFGIGVPEWQSYKFIGEHIFWIDIFAHYGILGALPFVLFVLVLMPFRVYYRLGETSLLVCAFLVIASSFIAPMIMTNNTLIALILFIGLKKKNSVYII